MILHCRFLTILLLQIFCICNNVQSITIQTIFGSQQIDEPVLEELLQCPTVQRLNHIHQYGIVHYACHYPAYSRYDHSIGVLYLLRHFGASLDEQIAGLLHDVSHTVFSHVGDHLFKTKSLKNSYQDDIHLWFLEQTEIPAILARYNIDVTAILHKNSHFTRLEKELPYLCADRLEYLMHGGLLEKIVDHDTINFILSSLTFENDHWLCTNEQAARILGHTSLYLTENLFGGSLNYVLYEWTAQILRRALEIELISLDDIHFNIDDVVWKKIEESSDTTIQELVKKVLHYHSYYKETSQSTSHDICIHPKFRGVNPLVKTDIGIYTLTLIDSDYENSYTTLERKLKDGICIKFTESR